MWQSGKKSFELRKNDRGYKEGDVLELMEFKDGRNTGREIKADIIYIAGRLQRVRRKVGCILE